MGFGKNFGLANKGKIHVNVERALYFPGETVNGNVFVDAYEPIECKAVVVQCKGKEKVFWQETRTRSHTDDEGQTHTESYEVDFDAKKEFFRVKMPLSQGNTMVPPGQWIYPFSFQLPMDLPASFKFKDSHWSQGENNKIKAKVEYSFKGTLDVDGFFAKDLKGKAEVKVMHAALNTFPPGTMTTKQTVRLCCCIPRGEVELTVTADKGAYYCGEVANLKVDVNNESSVEIEKMKAKLYRIMTLRADGHQKRWKHEMRQMQYGGCKEGETVSQDQQLPLVGDFLPVTYAKHITCEYRIEIECAIPWCPDVELHIPIGLYEPPPQVWGYQPPAGQEYAVPPPM